MMKTIKTLLFLMPLVFPTLVDAEVLKLECTVSFSDFVDQYTFEVDMDKGTINSTHHAATNKDSSVSVDYEATSEAGIDNQKIIFKAKLHSLDYTFEINRNTLEIIRYVSDVSDGEEGRGLCTSNAASGRTP